MVYIWLNESMFDLQAGTLIRSTYECNFKLISNQKVQCDTFYQAHQE